MKLVLHLTIDEFCNAQNRCDTDYAIGEYVVYKSQYDGEWKAKEVIGYGAGYNRDEYKFGIPVSIQIG